MFRAKTEDDLSNFEALGVQEMSEAISAYRQITVTPEFREMERLRSKARHDEAQALYNAERKTKMEMAKAMLDAGEPMEKVTRYTSLTRDDVER